MLFTRPSLDPPLPALIDAAIADLKPFLRSPPPYHPNPFRLARSAHIGAWPAVILCCACRRDPNSRRLGEPLWDFEVFVNDVLVRGICKGHAGSDRPDFDDFVVRTEKAFGDLASQLVRRVGLEHDLRPEDLEEFRP